MMKKMIVEEADLYYNTEYTEKYIAFTSHASWRLKDICQ